MGSEGVAWAEAGGQGWAAEGWAAALEGEVWAGEVLREAEWAGEVSHVELAVEERVNSNCLEVALLERSGRWSS